MASKAQMAAQVGAGKHPAMIFTDLAVDGPIIGTLCVVLDRGKNLPNRKSIGKQDPYCVVRLGKEGKRTEADKRGGQTPKWDTELRFPVRDSPDYKKLKIAVFNDDKKTDLIGETTLPIDAILIPGGGQNDGWRELKCRDKYAGEILVELTFFDTRPKEKSAADKAGRRGGVEKMEERKGFAGPRGGPTPRKQMTYMERKAIEGSSGRTAREIVAERERAERAEREERERANISRPRDRDRGDRGDRDRDRERERDRDRGRGSYDDEYEKPSRSRRDRRDRDRNSTNQYDNGRDDPEDNAQYGSPTETRPRRRRDDGSGNDYPEKKTSRRRSEMPQESRRSGGDRDRDRGEREREREKERYLQSVPIPNGRDAPLDSYSPGMGRSYQDRYDRPDRYDQYEDDFYEEEPIHENGYGERFDHTYQDDNRYRRNSPLPNDDPMQMQPVRKRATFAGYEETRAEDPRQGSVRPTHQRGYSHSPQPTSQYGGSNTQDAPPPAPPPHRKAAVDDRQFVPAQEQAHLQEFALVRQKSLRHYKSVPDWHPKNNPTSLREGVQAEQPAPRQLPPNAPRAEDFSPLKNFQPKNPMAGALTFRGRDNFNNIQAQPQQQPPIQRPPLGFDRALPPPNMQNDGPPPPPPPHAAAPRTVQSHPPFADLDKALVPVRSRPPSYVPTPLAGVNNNNGPAPYADSDEETIPPNYGALVRRGSFNPSPTPTANNGMPLPPSLVPGIDPQVAEELSERMAHERRMSFEPRDRASTVTAPPAPYVQDEDECDDDVIPPLQHRNSAQPLVPSQPSPLQYAPPTPEPMKKRQPSPQPPPRRSPSPMPPPANNVPIPERRLSGLPFSPDSYDEINPNAVAPLFSGSVRKSKDEMARASYRDRERKQIDAPPAKEKDPTDVLPPSTFAPEPEVKKSPTKEPEVYSSVRNRRAGRTPSPQPPVRRDMRGRTPSPQPPRRGEMLALTGPETPTDQPPVYGNEIVLQNDRNRLRKSRPSETPAPGQGRYPPSPADEYAPRSSKERLSIAPPPSQDYMHRSSRERLSLGPPPLDEYAPVQDQRNTPNDNYNSRGGDYSYNRSNSGQGNDQFVPRSIKERLSIAPPPLDEYAPRNNGRMKALPPPEGYDNRSSRERLGLGGPGQDQDDYGRGAVDRRSPVGPPPQDEYGYRNQMGGYPPNQDYSRSSRDRRSMGPSPGPGPMPDDYRRSIPPQDYAEDYDTRNGSARRSIGPPPPAEEPVQDGAMAMVISTNSRNYNQYMQDQQQMQMEQQQQQRIYQQQQYHQQQYQQQQYHQQPQQPEYRQRQPSPHPPPQQQEYRQRQPSPHPPPQQQEYRQRQPSPHPPPQQQEYRQRQPSPHPPPQQQDYRQRQPSPHPPHRTPSYQQPQVQQMQVQQPRHEQMHASYDQPQNHRHSMYNNNVIPEDRRLGGSSHYGREEPQTWDEVNREVMSLAEELKTIDLGPSRNDRRTRKSGAW